MNCLLRLRIKSHHISYRAHFNWALAWWNQKLLSLPWQWPSLLQYRLSKSCSMGWCPSYMTWMKSLQTLSPRASKPACIVLCPPLVTRHTVDTYWLGLNQGFVFIKASAHKNGQKVAGLRMFELHCVPAVSNGSFWEICPGGSLWKPCLQRAGCEGNLRSTLYGQGALSVSQLQPICYLGFSNFIDACYSRICSLDHGWQCFEHECIHLGRYIYI